MGGDEGAALGMPSVIWWGDLYPAKSKLDFRSATLYCTTISRLLIHKSSPNRTGLTATSRSTFDSSSHPSSISAYGSRFIAVVSSIIFVSTARITHHASPITHHHHDTYTKSSKRYRKILPRSILFLRIAAQVVGRISTFVSLLSHVNLYCVQCQ